MGQDIIDIVAKLSYELQGQGLTDAANALGKQIKALSDLKAEEKSLQRERTQNHSLTVREMDAIRDAIMRNKAAQIQLTKQIQESALANKKLLDTINQEVGYLGKLEAKINALRTLRRNADKEAIAGITAQIKALEQQQAKVLGGGAAGGLLGGLFGSGSVKQQIGQGLLFGLGIGGGFGIITKLISGITEAAAESVKLYREAEGIRIAYERLNKPDLLDNLRKATQGTVSDLTLMKYAVQASNFDVPLSKIAGLFAFARQRARETGVSVDYLVNSIIVGIGRESPKILDNLGINVRKVREEFNRTGDYATAVFNIINEQGIEGAQSIDTLADSLDRLNAKFENQQAIVGKELAEASLLGKSALLDLVNVLTNPFSTEGGLGHLLFGDTLLKQANKQIKLTHELAEQEQKIADASNSLYMQKFERFAKEFETADYTSRQTILKQAKDMYDNLLELARLGIINLQVLNTAYFGTFVKQLPKSQFNITGKAKTPLYALYGFSEEDLQDAQKKVQQFRLNLRAGDVEGITQANKYENEIQRLLDIIQGQERKKKEKKQSLSYEQTLEKAQELAEKQISEQNIFDLKERKETNERLIDFYNKGQLDNNKNLAERNRLLKENETIQKTIDFITGSEKKTKKRSYAEMLQEAKENDGILQLLFALEQKNNQKFKALYEADQAAGIELSQENRQAREEQYSKENKRLQNQVEQRTIEIELTFEKNKNRITELKTKLTQLEKEQSEAQDVIQQITEPKAGTKTAKKNTSELHTRVLSNARIAIFGDDEHISDPHERQRAEIAKTISAYQTLAQAASDAFQTIYEAQIRALDAEIQVRQTRVDVAMKLAERGNTEALRIEEERLTKTIKQREEFARKQQLINSALAVSDAIVAVASAASESGAGAIVIVPAVIAAIIAGYAAVAAATKESTAFAHGKVDIQGKGTSTSDSIPARISKGESVITAKGTAKNREILQMINKGYDVQSMIPRFAMAGMVSGSKGASGMSDKQVDKIVGAVNKKKTTLGVNFDREGVSAMVREEQIKDSYRFR